MMAEFKVHSLWPTPIYENKIELKDEWINLFKNVEFERMHIGNGDISKDRYILKKLPELSNLILNHMNDFSDNYLGLKNMNYHLTNSWVVNHYPNDSAQSHHHANSLFSGCLYLETPSQSGNIQFNKNEMLTNILPPVFRFNKQLDDKNHINCETYTVEVGEGTIVLFPSHLSHSVEKNLSNQNRYSLAFNIWFNTKLGDEEYILEIR